MDSKSNTTNIIRKIDRSTGEEIRKYFKGLRMYKDFVVIGQNRYFFPKTPNIKDQIASIYSMPIRTSDIFVSTFPRSGTTLTQELVWLVANNLDYNAAKSKHLVERYTALGSYFANLQIVPHLDEYENSVHFDKFKRMIAPPTEVLANSSDPRFIKNHVPLSMLPPNALSISKFIYVARDPRDVAVSLYHLSRLLASFSFVGDFKMFWDFFQKGLIVRSPYFEQIKEAWEVKDHPNMLFLFYEEIIQDTSAAIRKVSHFLGKQYTNEQIFRLTEHLKFENFKQNQSVNLDFLKDFDGLLVDAEPFVRRGKCGGWRDYFDEEMIKQAERWIEENLRGTDLKFPQVTRM